MTVLTSPPTMAAVAALGLPGTEHAVGTAPVDDARWDTFRAAVRGARLTGLLHAAAYRGDFAVTETQLADLDADLVQAMAGALVLESLLLDVTEHLDHRGIDVRVIKGSAVAHLDYPSPEQRAYGDVDVLVRSEQIDEAVAALTEFGLSRVFQPPRAGWDRRYGKGAMFRSEDGREVDLHRTFTTPPLGLRIQLPDLWSSTEALVIGGRLVFALPREQRLLNAAYSAAAGDILPAPATLRDIAQLALHPALDTSAVTDLAYRWGGRAVLASAVTAAWRELRIGDVTALSAWADRYRATEDERRELALYQRVRASETARALATARMLPSLPARIGYLWGLCRPDAAFARASTRSPLGRATRAAGDLRRARRSS